MNLMENSYLLFETIAFNGQPVRNVTKFCLLPDVPAKYFGENYILEYACEDDRLLEAISFDLYKDTSYWDIIMLLNGMTNMSELPVNGDVIFKRAEASLDKWIKQGVLIISKDLMPQYYSIKQDLSQGNPIMLYLSEDDDNEIVARKYIELLEQEYNKNEKYRTLKYITISDISELLSDLAILKSSPKIDTNLVIVP
ncbi:MAG: hypothetical protein ACYDD5_00225 [Sulfuricurvum sp.]